MCDGDNDCGDNWDERNCSKLSFSRFSFTTFISRYAVKLLASSTFKEATLDIMVQTNYGTLTIARLLEVNFVIMK